VKGIDDWESLRVHDFRRTFGTRCAEGGMAMPRLALIMGHADANVTEQYYVHLRKEDNAQALAKVAEELGLGLVVPSLDAKKEQTA
jgi:integrase